MPRAEQETERKEEGKSSSGGHYLFSARQKYKTQKMNGEREREVDIFNMTRRKQNEETRRRTKNYAPSPRQADTNCVHVYKGAVTYGQRDMIGGVPGKTVSKYSICESFATEM